MVKWRGLQHYLGINKLPKNYHTDYNEATKKYNWYYIGRHEGKQDFVSKNKFSKYEDAVADAKKHFKAKK